MTRSRILPLGLVFAVLVPGVSAQDRDLALVSAYATLAPHVDKARTAFRRGRLEKCEEEAGFCLKNLPEHQEAHFLMSQVLYKKGEYAGALAHIRAAEEGYLRLAGAFLVLEKDKQQRRSEDMVRLSDEIADLAAADAAVKSRGSCLPDKFNSALQDSRRELTRAEEERNKTDADKDVSGIPALYRYWHGNALFMLRRLAEAEAEYRRAVAKDPDFREAYNNLVNLLFMAGRLDEARAVLAQAEAHKAKVRPELKKAVLEREKE
jgi:tetratricopeptide (TPR) repeat protein